MGGFGAAGRRDSIGAPFWDGCGRGELLFQKCGDCGQAQYPPLPLCGNCQSDQLVWTASSGRGVLYTYSVVTRPLDPSFAAPYTVIIVAMDEGWYMLSNLVDGDPETIEIGRRLAVFFRRLPDGTVLPQFRPAE